MKLFSRKSADNLPRRRQSSSAPEASGPSLREQAQSFRRNRTITGSSSHKIASSTELAGTMLSPRAQVHHLSRHRRHLALRLGITIIVSLALYVFVSQLIATVSVRSYGTAQEVPAETTQRYTATVNEYFTQHPLARYYPATDKTALLAWLQAKHPEVKSVSLGLTGEFGKAQARLTLRQPVARWIINGQNEYVDQAGVVFGVNGYKVPRVTIVDQNTIALDKLNKKVITSNRFLVFVGQTVGDFSASRYTVTRATLPLLTTRQLHIKLKGVKYYIKMTIDRSAGEQVEDALRVIRYLKKKDIGATYVDVRVKGKAYYK